MKKTVTTKYESEPDAGGTRVWTSVERLHDGSPGRVVVGVWSTAAMGTLNSFGLEFEGARELWSLLGRALDAVDGVKGEKEGPG